MSDYKPFGSINYDNKLVDLKNDYKFTGQEYDEESSLQYFGARYLDNEIARFTSIDPVILRVVASVLNDPQSLNSYAYARNNPIIFVDPDGNDWKPFSRGTLEGAWAGLREFGQNIAATVQNPSLIITSPIDLAKQSYNDAAYLAESYKNDPAGTTAQIQSAFGQLSQNWGNLSDEQKGKITGYALEKGLEAYITAKAVNKGLEAKSAIPTVPTKAYNVLGQIEKNNFKSAPQGYKGGGIWKNDPINGKTLLPEKGAGYYKEWDINPKNQGIGRGTERMVTGQGGEAWYTPDHYKTFIKIK